MTNKIFSVATFILVAWLTVTLVTTSKQLTATEQLLSKKIDTNQRTLAERIGVLEKNQKQAGQAVLAELEKQNAKPQTDPAQLNELKAQADKLRAQLAGETRLKELKAAYKQVLESELEKTKDGVKAAEKLLETKKAIWKASTQHEKVKANLQGLMGPIDSLAARWKSGDTQSSVQPVFNVLQQTLATLDAQ